MTTRRKFNVFLFILLLGVFSPLMAQSMSDSQVLEYVKDGIRQGKEQKQLASELARRGVTKEQATRVKYNRQIKKFPTEKQNVSLKHILT
jgi:hypothetical protein